jgi:hypothetical protein
MVFCNVETSLHISLEQEERTSISFLLGMESVEMMISSRTHLCRHNHFVVTVFLVRLDFSLASLVSVDAAGMVNPSHPGAKPIRAFFWVISSFPHGQNFSQFDSITHTCAHNFANTQSQLMT